MYAIDSFDGITLSNYVDERQRHDMGGGSARGSFTRLPFFGFHDNYGDRVAVRGQQQIVYQGEIHPDATVPPGGKLANLRGKIDALRAKIGVRGKLYVRLFDTTQQRRWLWARLESVDLPSMIGNINFVPVTMRFSTVEQGWRAETPFLLANYNLGAGGGLSTTMPTSNNGTLTTYAMALTINAITNSITALTWRNLTTGNKPGTATPRHQLNWSGTLAAGSSLVIDTGAMSATVAGVNQYGGNFTVNSKHEWFALVPGWNDIRIEVTGNAALNSTFTLTYYPLYG